MTEEQTERGMEVRPDVELMVIPDVEWLDNALIFHKKLDDQRREQLFGGLNKFKGGYQWFYADAWREVEIEGGEWTDWIPDSIELGTAQTWRKVGDMFLPPTRQFSQLLFSHYAATRSLEFKDAHKILEAANENGWPEKAVREAVDIVSGKPEKQKKPKLIQHPPCGNWIADLGEDGLPCPWCQLKVSLKADEALRTALEAIRDNDISEVGLALRFDVDTAIKALEV